jgi:hypothetical protein
MTDIFVDPLKSKIAVQVTSKSLHAVGFDITVFASDGNTVNEHFSGDTRVDNPYTHSLVKKPADYKDCYISGIFTVISPDGTDYPFTIIFAIVLENILILPAITHTDTTVNGEATSSASFHIKLTEL